MGVVVWDGVEALVADEAFGALKSTLCLHGVRTKRRCSSSSNRSETCCCQGTDEATSGASFALGCAVSMHHDLCKFAKSDRLRNKFELAGKHRAEEAQLLEGTIQQLATDLAPLYAKVAPTAYRNQVVSEPSAKHCRLGLKPGRPFSGVTVVSDFCAHAHYDTHNVEGGSTVVVTLLRPENRQADGVKEDEQLHVLPLYVTSDTDEHGSREGQLEKLERKSVEILRSFPRTIVTKKKTTRASDQKMISDRAGASTFDITDSPVIPNEEISERVINIGDATEDKTKEYQKTMKTGAEADDFFVREMDNAKACLDADTGGLGIALTHGSVLFECARRELHATTALKTPNRKAPTRIGLVFYQHVRLNYPEHGRVAWARRNQARASENYQRWLMGTRVPTAKDVAQMRADGFELPEDMEAVTRAQRLSGTARIEPPDLGFVQKVRKTAVCYVPQEMDRIVENGLVRHPRWPQ